MMVLMRAFLAAACLSTVCFADVVELGVDNLASTIKSKPWTIIWFYDRENDKKNEELTPLMSSLDAIFAANATTMGFAKLDIRRHSAYRESYESQEPFIYSYYADFPASDKFVIGHQTFMDLNGDLYWPNKMVLMDHEFDVHGELDMDFNAQVQTKIAMSTRWIEITTTTPVKDKDIILSPINREREEATEKEDLDNSFTFSKYFKELLESKDNEDDGDEGNIRFLLEAGVNENADVNGDGYYKHKPLDRDEVDDWLDALSNVIDRYLTWVEGYETIWDENRKAREDMQTNFGPLLSEMNRKVRGLLSTVFQSETLHAHNASTPTTTTDCTIATLKHSLETMISDASMVEGITERLEEYEKKHFIPNLKPYLDEMVFGYGRSPATLANYFESEVLQKLGTDAATRRQARKVADTKQFALFERMREYMKVAEETNDDDEMYSSVLADLAMGWHDIVVEFHDKLNQYYLQYLSKHPLPDNSFKRKDIEIIDMEDPNNFHLLADYDEFHRRYTKPAIPVILSNVNMTDHPYTLDYLVEQCGATDVTSSVKVSNPVGKKSANAWGGLNDYELDTSLMNTERRANENNSDLTLQQFITLSQKLDTVYLHDCGLPNTCASILHEETFYDEHQKFRIPSVLASWDLFHRVPLYSYSESWPSLFIGKKGSNSKIHVDSGASGFFMYLVSGRKRWIITNPSERPFLYENIDQSSMIADVLGIDKSEAANEFLSKRFPLLHRVEDMYEVIQQPGQLMYIPPDSPHAVENLDDTVGLSLNLVPRDAFPRHLHDQIHGDQAFGYSELAMKYMMFEGNANDPMATKDPLYMTFAEYKGQV